MWHMKNPELTPMEVLEFWFARKYQTTQHLGCIGWCSCCIKPVQHFLGKYSVNTLYLYHHMSAKHHSFWHCGEFLQCSLCGGILHGGGVDQRLFDPCTTAPPEKIQNEYPQRDPRSMQQPHLENQVIDIT